MHAARLLSLAAFLALVAAATTRVAWPHQRPTSPRDASLSPSSLRVDFLSPLGVGGSYSNYDMTNNCATKAQAVIITLQGTGLDDTDIIGRFNEQYGTPIWDTVPAVSPVMDQVRLEWRRSSSQPYLYINDHAHFGYKLQTGAVAPVFTAEWELYTGSRCSVRSGSYQLVPNWTETPTTTPTDTPVPTTEPTETATSPATETATATEAPSATPTATASPTPPPGPTRRASNARWFPDFDHLAGRAGLFGVLSAPSAYASENMAAGTRMRRPLARTLLHPEPVIGRVLNPFDEPVVIQRYATVVTEAEIPLSELMADNDRIVSGQTRLDRDPLFLRGGEWIDYEFPFDENAKAVILAYSLRLPGDRTDVFPRWFAIHEQSFDGDAPLPFGPRLLPPKWSCYLPAARR